VLTSSTNALVLWVAKNKVARSNFYLRASSPTQLKTSVNKLAEKEKGTFGCLFCVSKNISISHHQPDFCPQINRSDCFGPCCDIRVNGNLGQLPF
jgi:hypothetical protein